jgi:glucose-6-phosphate dehydrogenase assembly protein OpcA
VSPLDGDVTYGVWRAQRTSSAEVEAALRRMLAERYLERDCSVPGRSLNVICVVTPQRREATLERVKASSGRAASRVVLCVVDPGRTTIDATAELECGVHPGRGEFGLLREVVTLEVGELHRENLEAIVDPLLIHDVPTVLWATSDPTPPPDGLEAIAEVMLLDSTESGRPGEALRRAERALQWGAVVDLAWLRSRFWRQRAAAMFDPPDRRAELSAISAMSVRHHPASIAVALLFAGWLGSRLGWSLRALEPQAGGRVGSAQARNVVTRIELLSQSEQSGPGLDAVTIETASSRTLCLQRIAGGLIALERAPQGQTSWAIPGAAARDGDLLAEGMREALVPDFAYGPALAAARSLAGAEADGATP